MGAVMQLSVAKQQQIGGKRCGAGGRRENPGLVPRFIWLVRFDSPIFGAEWRCEVGEIRTEKA